ncbi:hypothetical protein AB0K09_30975 [Streptomyces sp. NPDC049577]|uniref:hypothetical protein n=1 Tax=Streptomyces sp. NPDC049577 TaxID=3155153 RepID=UPI003428F8F9
MERSSKHGAKKDDELKKEMLAKHRTGRPMRSEEWRDPESRLHDEETPRKQQPHRRQ